MRGGREVNKQVDYQINRVKILSNMVTEKLTNYQNDKRDFQKWKKENPDKESWYYYKPNETTPTELKRVMLVLRQEMIKLGKML